MSAERTSAPAMQPKSTDLSRRNVEAIVRYNPKTKRHEWRVVARVTKPFVFKGTESDHARAAEVASGYVKAFVE